MVTWPSFLPGYFPIASHTYIRSTTYTEQEAELSHVGYRMAFSSSELPSSPSVHIFLSYSHGLRRLQHTDTALSQNQASQAFPVALFLTAAGISSIDEVLLLSPSEHRSCSSPYRH